MNRLLSNGYKPLYCDGVVEVGRFSANSIHATHYLSFSVKITTNRLHRHFVKQASCLKKGVSRMVLKEIM